SRIEVSQRLLDRLVGDAFGRFTAGTEAEEQRRYRRGVQHDIQYRAGPPLPGLLPEVRVEAALLQSPRRPPGLAPGDGLGQSGHRAHSGRRRRRSWFVQPQSPQTFARLDVDL